MVRLQLWDVYEEIRRALRRERFIRDAGYRTLTLLAIDELGMSPRMAHSKTAVELRRALYREVSISAQGFPRIRPYIFRGELGTRIRVMHMCLEDIGDEALAHAPCDPVSAIAIERQMLQWLTRQPFDRLRDLIEDGALSFRAGTLGL